MSNTSSFTISANDFSGANVSIAGDSISNVFSLPSGSDAKLLEELRRLKAALAEATDEKAQSAAAEVGNAEAAIAASRPAQAKEALARAGSFALDCAKEVGTHIAEAALMGALHLGA